MLGVNVMYDSGVREDEAYAIISAIQEAERIFPEREFKNYGSRAWSQGDYGSADWYLTHSHLVVRTDRNTQVDAGFVVLQMKKEPWQMMSPHIDIMFTSRDLTVGNNNGDYLNFCFGYALGRFTVQSVARFRHLNEFEKNLAIRMLFHHELGHILGMCGSSARSNTEESYGRHCTNYGCAMRQGLSVSEWVEHAMESWRAGMIYCPQCLADAQKAKI